MVVGGIDVVTNHVEIGMTARRMEGGYIRWIGLDG